MTDRRTDGDDVVLELRVRKANLPALEEGVTLGIDSLTGQPITLRLVGQPDGAYGMEVVTNAIVKAAAPEAVDATVVEPCECPCHGPSGEPGQGYTHLYDDDRGIRHQDWIDCSCGCGVPS